MGWNQVLGIFGLGFVFGGYWNWGYLYRNRLIRSNIEWFSDPLVLVRYPKAAREFFAKRGVRVR